MDPAGYDELSKESTPDLERRLIDNDRLWERWDRKSDPELLYSARQDAIAKQQAVIKAILDERAS
jgi:hypothetical protein